MNPILCQHNPKRSRFSLPNEIWKWGLKPQGDFPSSPISAIPYTPQIFYCTSADEIVNPHMSADMAADPLNSTIADY